LVTVQSTPLPERPWVPLLNPDSLRPVGMYGGYVLFISWS